MGAVEFGEGLQGASIKYKPFFWEDGRFKGIFRMRTARETHIYGLVDRKEEGEQERVCLIKVYC